jgi:nitrogenase molybdenum-iron protein alpha/beta subunit
MSEPEPTDFTQPVGARFMTGVFLAVNAIRDLYLLVEGPDCTHIKTQFLQGNHDWLSTLTSVSGFHRIANTALHPDQMSGSRESAVRDRLQKIASHPTVPAVALTSMPMAFVTGADYERVTAEVAEATGKPIIHVPGRSLSRDWLDGYAEVQSALAGQLELRQSEAQPENVAIVGYLFDRNEGDHTANLQELRSILSGLGLNLVSVWLGGQHSNELAAVETAGTIISLPYGRRAARTLARRLGARLIETSLPFGLPATEAWVRQLGAEFGRPEQAEVIIDRELARVIPKLEWIIPFVFQNLRVGYVGDPHLLPGLRSYLGVLGASLDMAVITNHSRHTCELPADVAELDLLVEPRISTLGKFLGDRLGRQSVDLLVGSDLGNLNCPVASYELGFPSPTRHALFDRPFLGFGGALALADSLANAMTARALQEATRAGSPDGSNSEPGSPHQS